MFDAQLLISKGTTLYTVYSPWMSRGGDNLRATLDVIDSTEAVPDMDYLKVGIATKNSEDTGNGTTLSGSIGPNGPGVFDASWGPSELKELVRYEFTVGGTNSTAGDWILFRMLSPVWFDSVS